MCKKKKVSDNYPEALKNARFLSKLMGQSHFIIIEFDWSITVVDSIDGWWRFAYIEVLPNGETIYHEGRPVG